MIVNINNKVIVNYNNIKKYILLGYDCKEGDVLELPIEHLPIKRKFSYTCNICGIEHTTTVETYKKSKYGTCRKCSAREACKQTAKDLTGQKFHRLQVLSKSENLGKNVAWNVKCDCGTEKVVRGVELTKGSVKSCGCYAKEQSTKRIIEISRNNSGEKHYNWNPELTEEDRYRSSRDKKSVAARKETYERDNYTCQICSLRNTNLNAHHIVPYSKDKTLRYELSNLITMCVKCHKAYHKEYKLCNINLITLNEFKEKWVYKEEVK